MVRIGTSDIKTDDDLGEQYQPPKEGRYHAFVKAVAYQTDKETDQVNAIKVDFEIIAGTTPGQEGLEFREYFPVEGNGLPKTQRFAIHTDLIGYGEAQRDIDFTAAVFKQLIVELEADDWKRTKANKKNPNAVRLAWAGLHRLGHPDVKDVPTKADWQPPQPAPESGDQGGFGPGEADDANPFAGMV